MSITKAVGSHVVSAMGPEDWYKNNKTNELTWIEGSGEHEGFTHLGKTYKGYVKVGKKKYGFSGGANSSVTLSSSLPRIDVVASKPCRYCLGGAGAYGPWNPDAIGMTISGNFVYGGGAGFSLSMGMVGNHFGIWMTSSGGVGTDVGVGVSFFVGNYVGTEAPSINNYMGIEQSNNLNLGSFSFGQSADITQINGVNYYGKNWETWSFGMGLSNSDITIFGGSSQVGFSFPLFR